jgi:hypothetical protein
MALQGPIAVDFGQVFPDGAFAVSIEPIRDFDASTKDNVVQAVDKITGQRLWAVEVYDPDKQARKADRTVTVKIPAPVQPEMPVSGNGDLPFRPVEFDGMAVTPYVTDKGRLGFSYRAKGMHAPKTSSRSQSAKDAA